MSTYRAFAARIAGFLGHSWKIFVGKPPTAAVKIVTRRVPITSSGFVSKRIPKQTKPILRQVIRSFRSTGNLQIRAAALGLWNKTSKVNNERRQFFSRKSLHEWHRTPSWSLHNIRSIFYSNHRYWSTSAYEEDLPKTLAAYELGSYLDKGSNAAVYEARLKSDDTVKQEPLGLQIVPLISEEPAETISNTGSGILLRQTTLLRANRRKQYPLAVKMMFNYDFSSRFDTILREMRKELVPGTSKELRKLLRRSDRSISSPHSNIVSMYTAFVDSIPLLPGAEENYPLALPPDLYEDGLGNERTLFVVMKRYSMTLREYLLTYTPTQRSRDVLFGQLMEAVEFLGAQRISHRDIKSNNVLVTLDHPDEAPSLVLTDFGCCWSHADGSMGHRYFHEDIDLGGNVQLRPPEIRNLEPSRTAWADFTKADLWGAGTMAYEIYTGVNPFYGRIDGSTYVESQLPALPVRVHQAIRRLVLRGMLKREPSERPHPSVAANVVALSLFQYGRKSLLTALLKRLGLTETDLFSTLSRATSKDVWSRLADAMNLYAAETILSGQTLSKAELTLRSTFLSRLEPELIRQAIPYFTEDEGVDDE